MKKIAILVFEVINNLGGILPFVQNLCAGLEEIGCEPRVFYAEWKNKYYARPEGTYRKVGYGLRTDLGQERIRMFAGARHTFTYKGRSPSLELRNALKTHDGVILASSIPSLGAKHMADNHDWPTVLQHGKPMIAIVHDCYWSKLSLHILPYRYLFQAFVGVHPAAFESLKTMPWKIACQVNPHDVSTFEETHDKNWNEVCITSWFKTWKHIEDILRAAPFMDSVKLRIAGGGIEHSYMEAAMNNPTGKGKGEGFMKKVEFYSWKKGDPDVQKKWGWIGKSIWEVALNSGNFKYEGFLLGDKLDFLQSRCGGLIDPAYHFKWGEHFNRTMVEAMLHHSIPFVRPYGISNNAEGKGKIFGPENAVMIPEDATPSEISEIIEKGLSDKSVRKRILAANAEKIQMFDRKKVAKEYIKLLEGKSGGLFGVHEGKLDSKTLRKASDLDLIQRFPRTFKFPR